MKLNSWRTTRSYDFHIQRSDYMDSTLAKNTFFVSEGGPSFRWDGAPQVSDKKVGGRPPTLPTHSDGHGYNSILIRSIF